MEVAALANAQVTNVSKLSRAAAVARPTVQGYFDTLVDTLIGVWLPAWRPRARVKEVGHPKFYFFDTGDVRALAGRLREPLERAERGPLLETSSRRAGSARTTTPSGTTRVLAHASVSDTR